MFSHCKKLLILGPMISQLPKHVLGKVCISAEDPYFLPDCASLPKFVLTVGCLHGYFHAYGVEDEGTISCSASNIVSGSAEIGNMVQGGACINLYFMIIIRNLNCWW